MCGTGVPGTEATTSTGRLDIRSIVGRYPSEELDSKFFFQLVLEILFDVACSCTFGELLKGEDEGDRFKDSIECVSSETDEVSSARRGPHVGRESDVVRLCHDRLELNHVTIEGVVDSSRDGLTARGFVSGDERVEKVHEGRLREEGVGQAGVDGCAENCRIQLFLSSCCHHWFPCSRRNLRSSNL